MIKQSKRWIKGIGVALVLVILLSLGWVVLNYRSQFAIIREVEELGGRAYFDYQIDWQEVEGAYVERTYDREWSLFHDDFFPDVTLVDLSNTQITDDQLKFLRHLPDLEELNLSGTKVTGSGLSFLPKHSRLLRLDVSKTPLVDAFAKYLPASVTTLDLSGTSISTDVIKRLGLPRSFRLTIDNSHMFSQEDIEEYVKSVGN